jgi:hypothetical protein
MLLSSGKRSTLARKEAAHYLGLIQFPPKRPQLAVPRRVGKTKRKGYDLSSAPGLTEEDVIVVNGLRCTTAFRTILDLAATVRRAADYRLLRRALREATLVDHELPERLEMAIAERRPFRGCRILESLLGEHLAGTLVVRSALETAFLEMCIAEQIPLPETNVIVDGKELDTYWRFAHAYVELDTYATHGTVRSFENDRARDGELVEAGLRGMRVTDRRLTNERTAVVRQTKALLGL